jgi:hypothetical protein
MRHYLYFYNIFIDAPSQPDLPLRPFAVMLPASFAARTQENADDTGDVPPAFDTLAPRHDVPAWTITLLEKASSPYSHLIALKGEGTASSGISPTRLPGEHRGTRGPGHPQGHRLSDASLR